MGFLTCERAGGPARPRWQGSGVRFSLPVAQAAALPSDASRVVIGIRPERFQPVPPAAAEKADCLVEGVVEVVEPLGSDQHILVTVGDASVTVRRPREERVERDEKVAFTVDPGHLHFFDAESGEAYR
jgi:multiple sugar transport system ATP-binding protein